jgi:glutamyl-tRNA(Gln) amidotransferase subunit D
LAETLFGYQGKALSILKKAGVKVGDQIRVTKDGEIYDGILMPRYELADETHIVIKLKNGYNIGIKMSIDITVKKRKKGVRLTHVSSPAVKEKKSLPTISIISTGGTIASRVDYHTGAVRPALSTEDLLSVVPELTNIANLRTEILFSLLSENVYAPHWTAMAKTIAKHIQKGVDGVIICHGTDTMGYTAAALSLSLQNLSIPIILVGSQRSSDRPSSDASLNLASAVQAATILPIAEVMVGMHETISDVATVFHRGTKVRKLHTSRRDAFQSVNSKPLARIANKQCTVLADQFNKKSSNSLILKPDFNEKVALIKFHPGFNSQVMKWFADAAYEGIILEGTGLGHISDYCFPIIEEIIDRGIFVGMCSQCYHGRVNMKVYDTGRYLLQLGVTSLEDMLSETAFVKLSWTLAQTKDLNEVKKIMLTNLAGEITPRSINFQN